MTGLPEIDGIQPVGVVTKIRGTGQRIDRSLHLGEKILVLVEAEVDEAYKLKQTGDGPKLHQVLQVVDLYELDDEDINVKALLRETRSFYRERDDRRAGRTPLPSDDTRQPEGVAGFVDGSGVVMSAAEIAEARGIDLDPAGDVIVVEFFGGDRFSWPEDWLGTGQSLAAAGGFMREPGGEPGEVSQVQRLLRPDDGSVIDEWTEADEDRRLLAAEQAAEAAEAAEVDATASCSASRRRRSRRSSARCGSRRGSSSSSRPSRPGRPGRGCCRPSGCGWRSSRG
jgi:hypothetical protein